MRRSIANFNELHIRKGDASEMQLPIIDKVVISIVGVRGYSV
jgi:ribosomal protein L5